VDLIIAAVLAFVAGTVFGIFGAGGSILLVPILVYILGLPVKVSLGMALLILVMTGGIAALAHARSGNIDWKVGFQWSALSVGGAYAGGRVAEFLHPSVLLTMFAVVVVVSAAGMLKPRRRRGDGSRQDKKPSLGKVAWVGVLLGFVTGMIGIGGGFLLVPALVLLCRLDVRKAIGTSLLVISVRSLGGFLGFAAHTDFPFHMTAAIALFNAVGSLVGERVGKGLPPQRLRPAFGVFLLVVGAVMIVQNAVEILSGRMP
jgi:uncharacterized membrane protein YfcA